MKTNKVLFVDDEQGVLNSVKRITMDEDYIALFATSGEEALKILNSNEISLIVTDMKMPNMTGLELLEKVKKISPNTMRIVLSGYAHLPQILATVNNVGVFKYITKPWRSDEEFLPAIREAIMYFNLKRENDEFKKVLEEKNTLYKRALEYNNKLMQDINRDNNNIKILNRKILDLEKGLFSKLKNQEVSFDRVERSISLINALYFEFLDTMPVKHETFNLKNLVDELKNHLSDNLKINIDDEKFNYNGNYKLIMLIIENLIKPVLKDYSADNINIDIKGVQSMQVYVRFEAAIAEKIFKGNIDYKIIAIILNEFSNILGGNLNINNKEYMVTFNANTKS